MTVANRPVYITVGINLEVARDELGRWVGSGGEGAKQWMAWLAELKNRGIEDILIACCDGLKGLPDSITNIWPVADVQLCVVHMVRNSLKYASTKHWSQIAQELREVYTAATPDAAERWFAEFEEAWGTRYPALIGVWRRSWEHFITFLRFPPEIRKIVCTTTVIESLNSRFRQATATRRRGHFPNEEAALKVLYLVIRDRRPNRANPTGRTHNWKTAINALAGFYGDRVIDNQ
ncbi:IS256 family transposase [Streptomyces sp. NPDC048483]|uniref:IS256 family transposase n=1 Tax=Streptomyces sp. NPDC048483 TaxID=3154927 RepID=UPI003414FA02